MSLKSATSATITIIALSVGYALPTAAASFHFETQVNDKAEYRIELEFSFKGTPLSEVLPNYLFSNELQVAIDQRTRRFHIKSTNRNLYTQLNKLNHFKMISEANQYGRDVEITHKCSLLNTEGKFSLNCIYDGLDDGIPFIKLDPIIRSSFSLDCLEASSEESINCKLLTSGKTKDINYIVISRTADRLAISGLALVVSNYYKAFLALEAGELEGYKSYTQDSFYKAKVSPIRSNFFKYMHKDRLQKTSHTEVGQLEI